VDPNFIIVPEADPLEHLWRAFPDLRPELDEGEPAYYTYARFADHLRARHDNTVLWQRAYEFFELLATSVSLQEYLVLGIFEPLSESPTVIERLRDELGPAARKLLTT
jgi:hypothetical protein